MDAPHKHIEALPETDVSQEYQLSNQQQAIVAQLGALALSGIELEQLVERIVVLMAGNLEVEWVLLYEYRPEKKILQLLPQTGFVPNPSLPVTHKLTKRSIEQQTILTGQPQIAKKLSKTQVPQTSPPQTPVSSGMSVLINGEERPFGTLSVYSSDINEFEPHDLNFIESVANLLGLAIARKLTEVKLEQSKNQLDVILQNLVDGITVQNTQGDVVYANSAALRTLGESQVHTEDPAKLTKIFQRSLSKFELRDASGNLLSQGKLPAKKALKGEKAESLIQYTNKRTLERRWSLIKSNPIFDDEGKVIFAVNILSDLTEDKKAEQQMALYKERLELAQKAGKMGVFEWDIVNDSVWWSRGEEALFKVPVGSFEDDFIERKKYSFWADRIHPEDRVKVRAKIQQQVKEKRTYYENEFRIVYPDEQERWIKSIARIYYSAQGAPLKMIGVNYDITERKRQENNLRFLAGAKKVLASSLNFKKTLQSLAQLAVPQIADWCAIDLIDDQGELQQVTIWHQKIHELPWAKELQKSSPIYVNWEHGIGKVLSSGRARFYPEVTEEMLKRNAATPQTLEIFQRMRMTSVIIVPLKAKGKTIGTITFISAESKRHYTRHDMQVAEQLASRASLAIENALLYEEVLGERERLNKLVANVPGLVWEAWGEPGGDEYRIDFVNNYIEQMLGYTSHQWTSQPHFWLDTVHPEDRQRVLSQQVKFYKSGRGGVSRFRFVTKQGVSKWVESQVYVVRDKQQQPVGMRGVTMDITDRMQEEQRKEEFISLASHELKTPLTSIKAFNQILLKSSRADSEQSESKERNLQYLDKMGRQIDKLAKLISDLLDVTKIQQGKLQLTFETFELEDLIMETVESLQQTTESHTIEFFPLSKTKIQGDADRLSQVITNLLSNALKYSPDAQRVKINVNPSETDVEVSVQDFGIGIAKKHLHSIFNRFYRVSQDDEQRFPGLGIGLYISKEIVERHGGEMWVESTNAKGSTFFFRLPLKHSLAQRKVANKS